MWLSRKSAIILRKGAPRVSKKKKTPGQKLKVSRKKKTKHQKKLIVFLFRNPGPVPGSMDRDTDGEIFGQIVFRPKLFSAVFFFRGAVWGDGAVLFISKNLRRQIF